MRLLAAAGRRSPRSPPMNFKRTHYPMLKLAELLMRPYKQRIMNNVHRSEYVECLVALALEDTWSRQEHWSEYDFTHKQSGKRLELKQSAARQAWEQTRPSQSRFKLKSPGVAEIYVFAWHGGWRDADHRDADQWRLFVVAERDLPQQQGISVNPLTKIVEPCTFEDLPDVTARVEKRK